MGVGVGVSLGPAAGAALAGAASPLKPTSPGEGVTNEVCAEAEGVDSLCPRFSCSTVYIHNYIIIPTIRLSKLQF